MTCTSGPLKRSDWLGEARFRIPSFGPGPAMYRSNRDAGQRGNPGDGAGGVLMPGRVVDQRTGRRERQVALRASKVDQHRSSPPEVAVRPLSAAFDSGVGLGPS